MECIHVGTPPLDFDCWESKTIYIHDFLDLSTKGGYVTSPLFKCFGHEWTLEVFCESRSDGHINIDLDKWDDDDVTVDMMLDIVKNDGSRYCLNEKHKRTFTKRGGGHGWVNAISRSKILQNQSNYLVNGALTIKLYMGLSAGRYCNRITPRQQLNDNLKIFLDEETSDLAFDVKGKILLSHKCIIKSQSEELYTMCEAFSKTTPMPINDVEPAVFETMLATFYGKYIAPEIWKANSEALLKASGKYGFSKVKSEAEVWYTSSLHLTVENVIDEFLKADGNNFACVREATLKFIAKHGEEITSTDSFARLHESLPLMKEVMAAVAQNSKKRKRNDYLCFKSNAVANLSK